MRLKIHCDGGARGNPGPAASAFVVLNENGEVVYQQGLYLGETTNNQAEYGAVLGAVNWLQSSQYNLPESLITFILDSELVVKQLRGEYKVKDLNLKSKKMEIEKILTNSQFKIEKIINVPRAENSIADSLVNQTLDAR
jgi:ribonuclease HI